MKHEQLTEAEKRKANREKLDKEPKSYPFKGKILGKKKTRRGKKKKPAHVLVNKRLREKELKKYKSQRKERWEQYQEFSSQ